MVGGQDELVFDGGSFVVSPTGNVLMRADQFKEDLYIYDFELPKFQKSSTPKESTGARSISLPEQKKEFKSIPCPYFISICIPFNNFIANPWKLIRDSIHLISK